MDNLFGAGAKVLVNIPLIVPEEDHIVWSFVMAGNLEQLQHLVSGDRNLVHVRNQWGQSIMHVSDILGPSIVLLPQDFLVRTESKILYCGR